MSAPTSPETAFTHLRQLFAVLEENLPGTRIFYAGVYLTDKYRAHWEADRRYNQLAQDYARSHEAVEYIDIPAVLADQRGEPLEGIFRKDGEHLNSRGYALWREAAAAVIVKEAAP